MSRMGQATSDQLRRLFFTEASTAARRLAKLVALHALDVHVCALEEPNIYTLGRRGLELLEADDVDMSIVHRSRVGRHLDEHLRHLNDLRVELVLGARGRADVAVRAFRSDLDLRRVAGFPPPSYIPDAIVELLLPGAAAQPSTALAMIVEIDTGAEGVGVFATKVQTTVELWKSELPCWGAGPGSWRPAVFVPSQGRAKALARAIVEADGGGLWLVAEFERVRERGAFGPVFATAEEVAATPRREPVLYRGALAPAHCGVPQ